MRRYPNYKDPRAFHIQREQRFDMIKGQEAITLTGLHPQGLIQLAGKPCSAVCRGLSIPAGKRVRVVEQSFTDLVVELLENQNPN